MRVLIFVTVFLIGASVQAFAAEPLNPEQLKETSAKYVNAKNLSDFLQNSPDPIAALNEISRLSKGSFAQELTKNYVAYEEATGGRDLSANPQYNKYIDDAAVAELGDFYGMNGGNANNEGEPMTANIALDMVDLYLPDAIANNPELAEKIKKEGLVSTEGIDVDERKLEDVAKRTKLDSETIKFILKAMDSGKVTSPALIKAMPNIKDGATNFVRENFANELAEAKRIKGNSDRYFAAYKQDMAAYDKFIRNMDSKQFNEQFAQYAKYFKPDQGEQAMSPYVAQAKALLDKAKLNYDGGVAEMRNLQAYLDRFQKQKLEPTAEKSNSSFFFAPNQKLLPQFSASGIFGFSASATSSNGSSIDVGNMTDAFAAELGDSKSDVSVNGTGKGFDIEIPSFGNIEGGAARLSDVSADIDTNAIAKEDTSLALTKSFMASAGGGGSDDQNQFPTFALTRYQHEPDYAHGDNWKTKCDKEDAGKKGSSAPASRNTPAECVERMYRLTPFGSKTNDYMSLVSPQDGTGWKNSSDQTSLKTTNAKNDTFDESLVGIDTGSAQFVSNKADNPVVLTRNQANNIQTIKGFNAAELTTAAKAYEAEGDKEFENFNAAFSNDSGTATKEAIEQGYCLMIEDPDGKYRIKENSNYVPTYDPYGDPDFDNSKETRHKKYTLGSGKKASVVRITNPRHPFAPRDELEWQDYPNPLNSVCGISKISEVCGTDKKQWIGSIYSWEAPRASKRVARLLRSLRIPFQERGYYKKPIVDNGGKILSTPIRAASYGVVGYAAYYACMAVSWGTFSQLCCDIAEHSACQIAILPDVKPDNKLPLSYTLAHLEDEGLPHVMLNAYDSYYAEGYDSIGYNWMTADGGKFTAAGAATGGATDTATDYIKKFGYNMPTITSTVTGKAGFGGTKNISNKKLEQYALTIVGMNAGYKPDESNSSDPNAQGKSCGTGGWQALVRYQERCARVAGVNCICDYQKALFKQTSWGYVMERISATGQSIDNKQRAEVITKEVGGKKLSRSQDKTQRVSWDAQRLASIAGKPYHAQAGYKLGGDEKLIYPGVKDGEIGLNGLGDAQEGSIIVMQEAWGDELTEPDKQYEGTITAGVANAATNAAKPKRPWMAAFVDGVNPVNGCLTVSTKNAHSMFLDACGNSENLGKVSNFEICPPSSDGASEFGKMVDCAKNHEYKKCIESELGWRSWTVYNPHGNPISAGGI